ncbi:hypothetical protein VPH35_129253 [Triticum aestivum]
MWGRMWSFGCGSGSRSGGGSDPEVSSQFPKPYVLHRGLSPPASFRVRETEEYDRQHGCTPSSAASFSSAVRSSYAESSSSSGAGLLPVKREWSEEPEEAEDFEFVPVKEEPEELGRRGVVRPEDFVADVDVVAAAIAERSVRGEAERRRHAEELEDLQCWQAVAANLAAKEKDDKWRRTARSKGRSTSTSAAPMRKAPPRRRP